MLGLLLAYDQGLYEHALAECLVNLNVLTERNKADLRLSKIDQVQLLLDDLNERLEVLGVDRRVNNKYDVVLGAVALVEVVDLVVHQVELV